jgi:hypothetical protein
MRYLFILFIPMLSLDGFCQQNDFLIPHYQEYDESSMTYGSIHAFNSDMVSSDFGPRRKPNYDWHGGVDYTCNSCEDNLALSSQDGWFYYGESSKGIRHVIINGNSDLAFLHLFSSLSSGKAEVLSKKDDQTKKVVLINHNGSILAWAATPGKVVYNGMDYDVENYISAGQPLGAIGGSGGFPAHLHIEELPDGVKTISDDKISKSPLQTLHYDIPNYSESNLYYSSSNDLNNVTEGVNIKYPGSKYNSILIRPTFPNSMNGGRRFGSINNLNYVGLFIRNKSLNFPWELISGPNFKSEFKYGGNLGEAAYPARLFTNIGSFTSTGIYPNAYADIDPKPYDNYLYCDFFHRIHKNDAMKGSKSIVTSNCPGSSRYNDGNYEFKSVLKTINGTNTEGTRYNAHLDNFQPYIQSVTVLIDGINIYSASWECSETGPQFSGYECRASDANPNSIIEIIVTTSEPLTSLSGRIKEFPGGFIPFSYLGGLNWSRSFQNINYLKDGDKAHLEFVGTDLNGNQLLDMKSMAGGNVITKMPINIPIRESNTSWKPARKGGDVDNVHEFCFKLCTQLKDDEEENQFHSPDCITSEDLDLIFEIESFNGAGDGWVHLDISGGFAPYFIKWTDVNGQLIKEGINEVDLTDLTAGIYCYLVTDNQCCEVNGCVTICPSITAGLNTGLTHPTDCQLNDGSIRIINWHPSGGRPPYDYHLEDIHGNRINPDPATGKYEELYAGQYFFITTDINGCTGSNKIELISPDDFFINKIITNVCNEDDGSIYIEVLPEIPDDLYTFNWSTGFEERDVLESMISQLSQGKYCVTVTSNITQCSKEDCIEIKGSGKPLALKYTTRIPCPNQNNGEVQLTVTGGSKPYKYKWSNGDYRSRATHLSANQYCVTITDFCQNSITECFDLTNVLTLNLSLDYHCPDKVNVISEPGGGNTPYQFKWSNGSGSKDLNDVQIGPVYTLTVTDKFGCTVVKEINTNPVELINPVVPCKGFREGEITFKISNPKHERVDVSYNFRLCQDCTPIYKISNDRSHPITFTLKELAGDKEYTLFVRIGDCLFEINFILGEKELNEEFKRYDEPNGLAICVYDLVCNDNRIPDGKIRAPELIHKGGNCQKFLFKECASVEVRCMGHPDVVKTIPGKKIHMRRLEAMKYAEELGLDPSPLRGNFCDHLWICHDDPFCVVAQLRGELGGKFKGIEKIDENCYKVKCRSLFGLIKQDYVICGENFIPSAFFPYYRDDIDYGDIGTKPKPRDCTPITLNFTDVLECWGKFLIEDGEKFTNSEMAKLVRSYENRREKYCAWITFCLEDYSIIKTNINDFECEDFHPPINVGNWLVTSTCDPHYYEGSDFVFCECDDPEIIKKEGICIEPRMLPRKCTMALKNNLETSALQILPFQFGNTYFNSFATVYQSEDFTTVNGIYQDISGVNYYQKYDPDELFNQLEKFDGAVFAHQNVKHNRINLIAKGNTANSFEIYSGDFNAIAFDLISSDEYLKFISYYPFENGFIALGEFRGNLQTESGIIWSSNSSSIFILYRNDVSGVTEISVLTGTEPVYSSNKHTNSFLLKRTSDNEPITLNGNMVQIDENVFKVKIGIDGMVNIQGLMNVNGNFGLLGFEELHDNSGGYILVVAAGMIQVGNESIHLPEADQLILLKWNQGQLDWYKNFNKDGIDIANICLESLSDSKIALGLNAGTSCNLVRQDPYYVGSTGSDIVILVYDQNGYVIKENRFGSNTDNELLKDLYYSEEHVLYLGGEISGATGVRQIGDLELIRAGNVENVAFISYINFNATGTNSFIKTEEDFTISSDILSISKLTPNPVYDNLSIEFRYAGDDFVLAEVIDLSGKVIEVTQYTKMRKLEINTTELPAGIYFIRLKDITGNYDFKRFVKM